MKSYKTFKQHPSPPEGVNPDWVWQVAEGSIPGWTVVTEEQYEAYIAGHQDAIATWDTWRESNAAMISVKNNILAPAIEFGTNTIRKFASENILLGITQAGMTSLVRLRTEQVISCLFTGSLYDAMVQIRAIPPENKDATFITDARLLAAINDIEDYLGMTRSESL
jgi:hypothetical protein